MMRKLMRMRVEESVPEFIFMNSVEPVSRTCMATPARRSAPPNRWTMRYLNPAP